MRIVCNLYSIQQKYRGVYYQNNSYFCPPPPFLQRDIFPLVQWKLPLSPRLFTSYTLYSRFFLINHRIFSPSNQFPYFCPPPSLLPPEGGGAKWKYTPLQNYFIKNRWKFSPGNFQHENRQRTWPIKMSPKKLTGNAKKKIVFPNLSSNVHHVNNSDEVFKEDEIDRKKKIEQLRRDEIMILPGAGCWWGRWPGWRSPSRGAADT